MKKYYYIGSLLQFVLACIIFLLGAAECVANLIMQPRITFFGVTLGVVMMSLMGAYVWHAWKEMKEESEK